MNCVDLATLVSVVDDQQARSDVVAYFSTRPDGLPRYSGARFDMLAGGESDSDVVTADDIVAVQMLSVVVPALVAVDLLEGKLGSAIGKLLRQVPTDVELGTASAAEHVRPGGPAEEAWKLLKQCEGVGWVIAGKVLARKRPRLVPIYDSIIRCVFRAPPRFWQCLDARLQDNGGQLRQCLANLRADTKVSDEISDIRLLDVVLWMRHRSDHRSYRCQGLDTG